MDRGLQTPFEIGALGVPQTAPRAALVRREIEHVLFTLPGERVNRPDFGCGVQRLLFAGASPELAAAAEYSVRVGLRRFLSEQIVVDAVRVTLSGSMLLIDVLYTVIETGEERGETFSRPLGEAAP